MSKEYEVVRAPKPSPIADHTSAAAWLGPIFGSKQEADEFVDEQKKNDPSNTYFVHEIGID